MTNFKTKLANKTKLWLFLLLFLAAVFRFYNLNWDLGHFFHSDERNIVNAVSQLVLFSQMDPRFYAYGSFLIYLYKITVDFLSLLYQDPNLQTDWTFINVVGRYYSALFSTMTIIPLFLLGRKLFNEKTAFLTCIFYALTVSSIQTAHFSITENFLTLSLITITYLSLLLFDKPSLQLFFIIGAVLGISAATKTTGLSFALIPLVASFFILIKHKLNFWQITLNLFLTAVTAVFLFTLLSPFTFLNWEDFLKSMRYENGVVLGTNPVVYTLQFTNTLPYLFQIKNLPWQMGLVVIPSLIGILLLLKETFKSRKVGLIIFLSFPLFYFLYIGSWHTKFIRYMVPLLPFLLLSASYFLFLVEKKWRLAGKILISIFIISSFLWTIAFSSIYTMPQTRIVASEWIYKNIPVGSTIYSEHWDEGLPIPLLSGSPNQYQINQLTIYEPDNFTKIQYYADSLSNADYVTITTRRLYGTLINLPEKYPITSRYYKLLFSEQLGFEKVAEFSSYPQIFGVQINDDKSEETFQVYDHPTSFIFKNTGRYSSNEIANILEE